MHTGGTAHDVTDELHPELRDVAERVARAVEIPVVGVDLLVTAASSADYVVVEANEQPGLANHGSQRNLDHFLDLLFPGSETPGDAEGVR